MTALLAIDCQKNRVRRYDLRRPGGRVHVTDEVQIKRPQCFTLAEQLEALRQGQAVQYIDDTPQPDEPRVA